MTTPFKPTIIPAAFFGIVLGWQGDHGAIAILAPYLFVGANIAVGLISLATLWLVASGRLLPQPVPVQVP